MIRLYRRLSPDQLRIPRESGDDPETGNTIIFKEWYSPRERG